MDQPSHKDSKPTHHAHVSDVEHHILDHITHHHTSADIKRELEQLRADDKREGHNFHRDLKQLNHALNEDLAKQHLPKISIEEHGGNYTISAKEEDAPTPVRHAMHAYEEQVRRGHINPNEGHFSRPDVSDYFSGPHRPINATEASPSHSGFGKALLERLGLPVTEANLEFLDAWQKAEGGSADNPFNTTQGAPGAVSINGVGVKRYTSIEEGIEATAKTLKNGHYGEILAALGAGDNAHRTAVAVAHTPWGTGSGVARLV